MIVDTPNRYVARENNELSRILARAKAVSPEYPVVVSKFETHAREPEIDAVADGGEILVWAINECNYKLYIHFRRTKPKSSIFSMGRNAINAVGVRQIFRATSNIRTFIPSEYPLSGGHLLDDRGGRLLGQ
jgi:hypothetical protein